MTSDDELFEQADAAEDRTTGLYVRLDDPTRLRDLLVPLADLMADLNLVFGADGMSFQGLDTSHVCLASGSFPAKAFNEYHCVRPVTLGVDLKLLGLVFKAVPKNSASSSILILSTPDFTGDEFTIEFIADTSTEAEGSAEAANSTFTVRTKDIDVEAMDIPETQADASWTTTDPTEFPRLVESLVHFSDTARFTFDTTGPCLVVETLAAADAFVRAKQRITTGVSVSTDAPSPVRLALKYLKTFAKSSIMKNAEFSLQYTADAPVKAQYKSKYGECVTFYLAPQVDDEATAASAAKRQRVVGVDE